MTQNKIKNIIGPQVEKLRKQRRWSRAQLAAECRARGGWNADEKTIAKIENQTRRVLDKEIPALAKALGVEINALVPKGSLKKILSSVCFTRRKKTQIANPLTPPSGRSSASRRA